MAPRKFYRSVFKVEVLSEEPVEFEDLNQVYHAITTGGCSGQVTDEILNEEVDGKKMAELLEAQASDPGFFMLNDDGTDMYENEDEEAEADG